MSRTPCNTGGKLTCFDPRNRRDRLRIGRSEGAHLLDEKKPVAVTEISRSRRSESDPLLAST